MSDVQPAHATPTARPRSSRALLVNQVPLYGLTGGLAGVASVSTFQAFNRLFLLSSSATPTSTLVGKALMHGMIGSSVRFGGYALTRNALQLVAGDVQTAKGWQIVAKTGLAGAGGGALEGFASEQHGTRIMAGLKQGSRLGIGFTTYATLLDRAPMHTKSEPAPFVVSLMYGNIAGTVALSSMHLLESSALLLTVVRSGVLPRGALAVGVAISVNQEAVRYSAG